MVAPPKFRARNPASRLGFWNGYLSILYPTFATADQVAGDHVGTARRPGPWCCWLWRWRWRPSPWQRGRVRRAIRRAPGPVLLSISCPYIPVSLCKIIITADGYEEV